MLYCCLAKYYIGKFIALSISRMILRLGLNIILAL